MGIGMGPKQLPLLRNLHPILELEAGIVQQPALDDIGARAGRICSLLDGAQPVFLGTLSEQTAAAQIGSMGCGARTGLCGKRASPKGRSRFPAAWPGSGPVEWGKYGVSPFVRQVVFIVFVQNALGEFHRPTDPG
jgi:hypothetical protein